ncbi:MAG: hypothetical protein HY074_14640 [Deltaproteobacteria bacterium]|nr:hypothetical protein [Deltaproteobacteria bacterium]
MAHRTNVTQVKEDLEKSERQDEIVVDPYCGQKMPRGESRHLLFRGEEVFYFCSLEHKEQFVAKAA